MEKIYKFSRALRMFFYNKFFNRIPFASVRMFFVKHYFNVGKQTNILSNVTLLHSSMTKSRRPTIGDNCIINPTCLLDGRGAQITIKNNVDIARGTWIFTMEHNPHSDTHELVYGDVVIEDEKSAEILITIEFDEPVKIVEDVEGPIYWSNKRWRIQEYEVHIAEKFQLVVDKRD